MLKSNFVMTFATLLILFSGHSVDAQTTQEGLSMGPSTRPFSDHDGTLVDDLMDYDAQLWAPYDITSMSGKPEMHSGVYARLGFAYLSMSGPSAVPNADPRLFESVVNWTWGRDLEFGYNSDKKGGWSVNWVDYDASAYLRDSEFSFNSGFGGYSNPMILRATYDSVSVNRQFRQALSTGGYIEPFIGFRYLSVIDQTNEDWTVSDPIPPIAPLPIHFISQRRFSQKTRNSMAGGHMGTRYFRQYGRYKVGSNLGIGASYNNQTYSATTMTGDAPDGEPSFTYTNRSHDFVPFIDMGAEINYMLTRDLSIRFGAKLNWAWQGVARADTRGLDTNPYSLFATNPPLIDTTGVGAPGLNPDISQIPSSINTEDLVVGGFSFGIDWKR